MTWAVLMYILKVVVALGAVATSVHFVALYWIEGETDDLGERIGPPRPIGAAVFAMLGLLLWLPLVPVFWLGA